MSPGQGARAVDRNASAADQSVRAAGEVRRHRDDGKRRIPRVRALIGASQSCSR